MFAIIDVAKRTAHRDVVADPVAHGWVLNLYLSGERYPEAVTDYFQHEYAPTVELADAIRRHAADENKHVRLYEHALSDIRQPVVDVSPPFVFNEVVRSFTPETFHARPDDPSDVQRFKLANFLAHAHFLEKRVGRSIEYHADACGDHDRDIVGRCVAAVIRDEHRHVTYTIEAVRDLLTRRQFDRVLDAHRRAEAKANLQFSRRLLRRFRDSFAHQFPRRRRLMYRVGQMILDGADRVV